MPNRSSVRRIGRGRRAVVVATAALLALSLASCGGSSGDGGGAGSGPNDLASKDAVTAFKEGAEATIAATDIVASGTVPVNGVTAKVRSEFGGDRARAQVTSKNGDYQVVTAGQFVWVKGDVDFWTPLVGRANALKIGDKWAQSLAEGPLQPFTFFVDKNSFFRASGRITKGEPTEVNGEQTLPITDPKSNTDSTWWFRTTGEPVLMKYRSGTQTKFDLDYDQVVVIDIPPNDQVVDIGSITVPTRLPTPRPTSS